MDELLNRQVLSESAEVLQLALWPSTEGATGEAEHRRGDSYRQALLRLRRCVEEYNALRLDTEATLRVGGEAGQLALGCDAVARHVPAQHAMPLFPGTLVLARLAAHPIDSRRRAMALLEFLCEDVPVDTPDAARGRSLPEWRGERLVRRGMGEVIARLVDEMWPLLPLRGGARPSARALQASALVAVGLARLVAGSGPATPPIEDPVGLRAWKHAVRASIHTASCIELVEAMVLAGVSSLAEAQLEDEARQLSASLWHRRLSEAHEAGDGARAAGCLRRLEAEGALVAPGDHRPGALAMRAALLVGHAHCGADARPLLAQMQSLEQECLAVGDVLLAARLECHRVHLLRALGCVAEARAIAERNVATRLLFVDRSGVQFALRELAALEAEASQPDPRLLACLDDLRTRLASLTSDYAARVTSPSPTAQRRKPPCLTRWLPHLAEGHIKALLDPPRGLAWD